MGVRSSRASEIRASHRPVVADIVTALYESASGDESWDDTGARLGDLFLAHRADFFLRGRDGRLLVSEDGTLVGSAAIAPDVIRRYLSDVEAADPLGPKAWAHPRARAWVREELLATEEWRAAQSFRALLSAALDTAHLAGVCVDLQRGALQISLRRSARHGPFSNDDRERLQELVPHLARAWDLTFRLRDAVDARDIAWASLDAMAEAALAVDGAGRILRGNAAGEELRRRGVIPRDLPGRGPLASRGPARTRRHGRTYLWVYRPVPARLARSGAAALVFVSEETQVALPCDGWLRARFGLSPAEAELAKSLLDGVSVKEIAERRGVTEATARSQLRSVFRKTDTTRQGQLVSTILRAMPRLRREDG